ncbi:MAG: hypothetical protein JXQ65_03960 [Candidatus Marinimicrobia bacterium]|nr:hypothetical protein [Candidatus Neomarinimicrobiota bacterium]
MRYPWYDVFGATEKLQQGDFIKDLPIFFPQIPKNEGEYPADILTYDVIILSQSCDLEWKKTKTVLICPYKPYSEFVKENTNYGSKDAKKALSESNAIAFHLLEKCKIEGFIHDFLIVDFRHTFSVPLYFLEYHAKKSETRLRLLPPYREQLSQNFARFFMRVGLPNNIEGFVPEK